MSKETLLKSVAKGALIGAGASVAAKPQFDSENIKKHAIAALIGAGISLGVDAIDNYQVGNKPA